MRILVTGFIAFALWSALSTYIYVCKIRGLCFEPTGMQVDTLSPKTDNSNGDVNKLKAAVKVIMPEDMIIYFAFDKSDFTSDAKSETYFSSTDSFLIQNLNSKISITGHTDAVGSDEYNQSLGLRRAQKMQQYFESKGIISSKIIINSKGEKEPASNNSTETGRSKNRRAVITINK